MVVWLEVFSVAENEQHVLKAGVDLGICLAGHLVDLEVSILSRSEVFNVGSDFNARSKNDCN